MVRTAIRWIGATGFIGLLLLGAAVYWLFYDNDLPREGRFDLDLSRLRTLAAMEPGPGRIEVEELSHTIVPKIGVVAGTSWRPFDMMRVSYRLVYPDRSIVIDTGYPFAVARQSHATSYDLGAWQRIQRALLQASAIVVTHEHADHLGGIMASPNLAAVLPNTRLTSEQVEDSLRTYPLHWRRRIVAGYKPLTYEGLYALAPGVVLIRSPGHTPGSQMVYVRRADGREVLFMGDVASAADNVELQHIRPRYTTDYFGITQDDRRAVMLQTMALHRLHERYPAVVLVPGHDAVTLRKLENDGLLRVGFSASPHKSGST